MNAEPNPVDHTNWHISLVGGLKRGGRFTMPARTAVVTPVGGADLDLREARFISGETVVTKVSIIGGVRVTVPAGIRVVVEGFTLFGGRRTDGHETTDPEAPTVRVRAFGVVGGVRVQH